MSLLFVHDHRFKKVNGKFYSNGGLNDTVLKRYTELFGKVTVAARVEEANEAENYSVITNKNVSIQNTYMDFNATEDLVKQNDFIIFRLPSKQGILSIKYAKKHNKPYMIELVGCPWDAYCNHSLRGKVVAPIMWLLTRRVVKNAPYVLYVSNEFLQKRYPTKGKTVACSDVVLEEITYEVTEKRKERIESLKNRGKYVLSTVGAANVRYKGQQYVIRAIAELLKKGYDFEYKIIGGGNTDYLRSIAKKYGVSEKVTFVGSVSHDKVFDLIDETDIYIQPSNQEGLPRAVVEAMSRGCPVVGSSTGGIPELVKDGYVFKRKKVRDLVRVLEKAINSDFNEMSKYSFEKAKEFVTDSLEKKRNDFYLDFAGRL